MIFVDTPVFINYFKGRETKGIKFLDNLIQSEELSVLMSLFIRKFCKVQKMKKNFQP